jgi:hypothetical protein
MQKRGMQGAGAQSSPPMEYLPASFHLTHTVSDSVDWGAPSPSPPPVSSQPRRSQTSSGSFVQSLTGIGASNLPFGQRIGKGTICANLENGAASQPKSLVRMTRENMDAVVQRLVIRLLPSSRPHCEQSSSTANASSRYSLRSRLRMNPCAWCLPWWPDVGLLGHYPTQERRGDGPQVEMEDIAQVLQTVHRELDSCTDLVGDVLGDITQQGNSTTTT